MKKDLEKIQEKNEKKTGPLVSISFVSRCSWDLPYFRDPVFSQSIFKSVLFVFFDFCLEKVLNPLPHLHFGCQQHHPLPHRIRWLGYHLLGQLLHHLLPFRKLGFPNRMCRQIRLSFCRIRFHFGRCR